MSAQGIRAGRAYVELFADDSKLQQGLKRAQASLKQFGESVNRIGKGLAVVSAGILGPMALAVKSFADAGDSLGEMAGRTGLSVQRLQELGYAASVSGASMEDVEKATRGMGKTLEAAFGGDVTALSNLAALGITLKDLKGLSVDEQFDKVAKAVARIKNPTDRSAAALGVFGRGGTQLLPMIADMDALTKRAHELGAVMSDKDVGAAGNLKDGMDDVAVAMKGAANAIGAALAPALTSAVQWLSMAFASVRKWISANPGFVTGLASAGVALGVVAAAALTFGTASIVLGSLLGQLSNALKIVNLTLGAIRFTLLTMASPFALVAAGAFALGAVLVTSTETGRGALRNLSEGFGEVADDAKGAFKGISDALAAGDIMGAVKVLWSFIKLEFTRGVAFVTNFMTAFASGVSKGFLHMSFGIGYGLLKVINFVESAWDTVAGWLIKGFAEVQIQIGKMIRSIGDTVASSEIKGLAGAGRATSSAGADLIVGGQQRINAENQDASNNAKNRQTSEDMYKAKWDDAIGGVNKWQLGIMQGQDEKIAAAQAELTAANQAMAKARTDAEKANADRAKKITAVGDDPQGAKVARIAEGLKLNVIGGFNLRAAGGIGVGTSAAERTAKAAERIEQNTTILATQAQLNSADSTVAP